MGSFFMEIEINYGMKIPFIKDNPSVGAVVRGVMYSVIITMLMVLIFAGVLIAFPIDNSVIKPVVQVIKVLSIFLGVMVAMRVIEKKAWLSGGIVGLLYTVFAFFVFSIIFSDFSIASGLLTDMIFATIIGALSAMVFRTLKSSVN